VEPIFPGWVSENAEGFKTLNIPSKEMTAFTVEAFRDVDDRLKKADTKNEAQDKRIEEQDKTIKEQAKTIKEQAERLADQEERIERLENVQGLGHRIAW
jgi:uncharacterized protein (DUF3084 family)